MKADDCDEGCVENIYRVANMGTVGASAPFQQLDCNVFVKYVRYTNTLEHDALLLCGLACLYSTRHNTTLFDSDCCCS